MAVVWVLRVNMHEGLAGSTEGPSMRASHYEFISSNSIKVPGTPCGLWLGIQRDSCSHAHKEEEEEYLIEFFMSVYVKVLYK